jgi:hypothetical protein
LTITATETTNFPNDVTAIVTNMAGIESADLLLVDSAVTSSQVDPTGGTATMTPTVTQVIINDSQATTVTIPDTVTNGTLNLDPFINGSAGIMPAITINSATSTGDVDVAIPADTTITGPAGWSGVMNAPQVRPNNSVTPVPSDGMIAVVSQVIEIGFGNEALTFDKAVRIRLAGEAGKLAGYSRGGPFIKITDICSDDTQAVGNALTPVTGDCKMDVGGDLIIWTKHFSDFGTYGEELDGGGGGGCGVLGDADVCLSGDVGIGLAIMVTAGDTVHMDVSPATGLYKSDDQISTLAVSNNDPVGGFKVTVALEAGDTGTTAGTLAIPAGDILLSDEEGTIRYKSAAGTLAGDGSYQPAFVAFSSPTVFTDTGADTEVDTETMTITYELDTTVATLPGEYTGTATYTIATTL